METPSVMEVSHPTKEINMEIRHPLLEVKMEPNYPTMEVKCLTLAWMELSHPMEVRMEVRMEARAPGPRICLHLGGGVVCCSSRSRAWGSRCVDTRASRSGGGVWVIVRWSGDQVIRWSGGGVRVESWSAHRSLACFKWDKSLFHETTKSRCCVCETPKCIVIGLNLCLKFAI